MFENLTERLSRTVQQLRGKGRLTEDGIRDTNSAYTPAMLNTPKASTELTTCTVMPVEISSSGMTS